MCRKTLAAILTIMFVLPFSAFADASSAIDWSVIPVAVQDVCATKLAAFNFRQARTVKFQNIGKIVYRFKAVNYNTGALGRLCFDEQGTSLADCGDALREADAAMYFEDFGAIDPQLWSILQAAKSDEQIPVGIWLRTYEPDVAKDSSETALAARAAEIKYQHQVVKQQMQNTALRVINKTVSFISAAPAAFANLTPSQIVALAKEAPIASVSYNPKPVPQSTTYVSSVNADISGETGSNVKVCIIEASQPTTPNNLATASGTYCSTGSKDSHARCVNAVIDSTSAPYGVATDILPYRASWDGCDANAAPAFDWCIDNYTDVWNWSHTCSTTDNRLFDYWTKANPYPLIVAASGNSSASTVSCGSACTFTSYAPTCVGYSTLMVGAANDCATSGRTDDNIACFSGATNPSSSDRELPMLVAPGQGIDADGISCGDGTSFATPAVAGVAAHLIEKNNTHMNAWPELMRAVLMATAGENVDGGRLTALPDYTADHRDGAGEVDARAAVDLADSANKMDGSNTACGKGFDMAMLQSSSTAENAYYSEQYKLKTTSSARRARIVIAWDGTATCSDPSAGTCSSSSMDADLDLEVTDGTSTWYSNSSDNTYEFLEIPVTANTEYTIKIYVYDWVTSSTFLGVAWYVDGFDS